jgi:hypothetical protein
MQTKHELYIDEFKRLQSCEEAWKACIHEIHQYTPPENRRNHESGQSFAVRRIKELAEQAGVLPAQ